MNVTPKQLNVLRHAIGYDDAGNDRYPNARSLDERRNCFVTGPGSDDFADCEALVTAGLMQDRGAQALAGGSHYFTVTDAGRTVVIENRTITKPLTRSQQRYQEYRKCADCFDSFRHFLKYKSRQCSTSVLAMATLAIFAASASASPIKTAVAPRFFTALHAVETSGRTGSVIGDAGAALGPYQIHRSYWKDARVNGRYEQCADEPYARRVVTAYLTRYAPVAVKSGDWQTLARIHNGGPQGDQKAATLGYWKSVERELNHRWTQMDTDRKDNFRADWGKSESELNKPQQLLKSHALIISQRTPMVAHHLAQVARPGSATLPGLLSLGVPAQGHAITAGVGFTGGRRRNPSRLDHTGHPESVLKRTAPPANPKNSPVRRALARTSPAMSPAIATTPVSCRLVCTGLIPHASRPLKRPGFSGDNFGNAEVSHRSGPVAT